MKIKNNNISIYRIGVNVVLYIFAVVGFWAVLQSTSDFEANNDHIARENLLKQHLWVCVCLLLILLILLKRNFLEKENP